MLLKSINAMLWLVMFPWILTGAHETSVNRVGEGGGGGGFWICGYCYAHPVPTTDPSTIPLKNKIENIRYIEKIYNWICGYCCPPPTTSIRPPLGTIVHYPVAAPCLPTCPLAHLPRLAAFLRVVTSNPRHAGLTHSANQKPTSLDGKNTRKYWSRGTQKIA